MNALTKMLNKLGGVKFTHLYCNFKQTSLTFGESKVLHQYNFIPNYKKFWLRLCSIKYAENVFRKKLLDELISECDLNYPNFTANTFGKQLLIKLDFSTLNGFGVDLNPSDIINKLLSNLEPFPFVREELEKQSLKNLSVAKIRNVIEKQYLSWKYKVDEEKIESVYYRFRTCFYPYRSIENLKKNIVMFETLPGIQERNVFEKIYLLNQKPCDLHVALNFQKKVAGVVWFMFPEFCLKMLRHSHLYIISLVSVLQNLKFSETQIQNGFPFLYLPFGTIFLRLNNLLKRPEIAKYRSEDLFLQLLYFSSTKLSSLGNTSFMELIEIIRISKKAQKMGTTQKDIFCLISQLYEIDSAYLNLISRHSGLRNVSGKQIYDTLCFLKENKFRSKEVAESLTIIFYSRDLIVKSLNKIKEEELTLKNFGFHNGCVPEKTLTFAAGTVERRKTLQLCLYYLEKSFNSFQE